MRLRGDAGGGASGVEKEDRDGFGDRFGDDGLCGDTGGRVMGCDVDGLDGPGSGSDDGRGVGLSPMVAPVRLAAGELAMAGGCRAADQARGAPDLDSGAKGITCGG